VRVKNICFIHQQSVYTVSLLPVKWIQYHVSKSDTNCVDIDKYVLSFSNSYR